MIARAAPLFREAISGLIRWSGAGLLVRHTLARRRVSILVYHDPAREVIARHLAYLSTRYTFIRLAELVRALEAGRWSELPDRALVVTFDDGHRGNAGLRDLFQRHGVVPTIFLCSQIVGTSRHFWFLDVADSEPLKALSNRQRNDRLAANGLAVTKEYPDDRHALSIAELAELAPAVDFGAHTRFHPILPTCDADEAEIEITAGKREVEALVGASCETFAYPNGDYGEREIELLRRAGYRAARTWDVGWNDPDSDPFRLKMLGTTDTASVTRLAADLSGIPGYLSRLREGSLRGRHRSAAVRGVGTRGARAS